MKKIILSISITLLTTFSALAQNTVSEPASVLELDQDPTAVLYSPDGSLMAVASWDRSVYVYRVDSTGYQEIHKLTKHTAPVSAMAFSRDNKMLATVADDKAVIVWDTETGNIKHMFMGHGDRITGVLIEPSLRFVITCSLDKTVRFWDMKPPPAKTPVNPKTPKRSTNRVQQLDFPATALTTDFTGRMIFVAGNNNIQQYNVTGKLIATFEGHSNTITGLDKSLDKKYIASMSTDRSIIIWDIQTAKQVHVLRGHSWDVTSIQFSGDSKYLVSCGKDGKVILWDVATGNQLSVFQKKGTKVINGVTISADEKTIAAATSMMGSPAYGVVIWNSGVQRELPKPKKAPVKKTLPPKK